MDFEERKTLFNIRKTVIEMLQDRNYIVPQSELINFDDFSIKFKNKNLDIFIDNTENDKSKFMFIFIMNQKQYLKLI